MNTNNKSAGGIAAVACAAFMAMAGCGRSEVSGPAGEMMKTVIAALDNYCLEFAQYPDSITNAAVMAKLKSYQPSLDLTDPWGHALVYRSLGPEGCEVRSAGPDGQLDTGDDSVVRRGARTNP